MADRKWQKGPPLLQGESPRRRQGGYTYNWHRVGRNSLLCNDRRTALIDHPFRLYRWLCDYSRPPSFPPGNDRIHRANRLEVGIKGVNIKDVLLTGRSPQRQRAQSGHSSLLFRAGGKSLHVLVSESL